MMDMDRIRDEMAKRHDHPGILMIGEYATERIGNGAKLPEGKNLAGAFEAIRKYAEQHKTGNYAFVPPDKAYEIVNQYFGWDKQAEEPQPAQVAAMPTDTLDDLDLDAILGW